MGRMIDTDKALKANQRKGNQSIVPSNWELMCRSVNGEEQQLAKGVVSFDIDENDNIEDPVSGPKPEFAKTFAKDPASALAYAYDIVLNGNEIGGGSIRIHQREVQQRVFKTIGLSNDEAESKFGFLLEAFNYGPPPHGGIAFGWDRICMLLSGATSLRDVIAFPKTGAGFDPLTSAPTPITDQQRLEAGIDADPFAQDASDD